MRIIFISNFLNFHQSFLWDDFLKHDDVDFVFLSTQIELNPTKKQLYRKYVMYSHNFNKNDLKSMISSFDVIIIGDCKDERILPLFKELSKDKIVFHNSEHFWKKTNTPLSFIKRVLRMMELKKRYRSTKRLYLLSNSSKLKREFDLWKIPYVHCFRFGYFPNLNTDRICLEQKENDKMIFVGRLIKWKRPLMSIEALTFLNKKHQNYSLSFFGEGHESKKIEAYIKKKKPFFNCIYLEGNISHDEIIKQFNKSDIFIFSSNKEEGWGAVLNEAMASGCIVFASLEAGSSNYLIKDGYNGFIYKTKKELFRKLDVFLSFSAIDLQKMRERAFLTICNEWNYSVSSARLYEIIKEILFDTKKLDIFKTGPLSIQGE